MTKRFEDVLDLLSTCTREELRDHSFGDAEVYWFTPEGHEIACGYDGSSGFSLTVYELNPDGSHVMQEHDSPTGPVMLTKTAAHFDGEAAKGLRHVGKLGKIERNDEAGPVEFKPGQVMPGLTLGAVWDEITNTEKRKRP